MNFCGQTQGSHQTTFKKYSFVLPILLLHCKSLLSSYLQYNMVDIKMARPQSKNYYEPRSINHFEALEQTCRLRQLSGSGGKYFCFLLAESIKATVHTMEVDFRNVI
jgi:hypothetical protein